MFPIVDDAPELEVTPMDGGVSEEAAVEVTLGGAVQLQCPAGASGCWSRVGKDGSLDPIGPGPKLSLDRILYQEAGEYRCVVARSARLEQWRAHNVHVSVSGQFCTVTLVRWDSSRALFSFQRIRSKGQLCMKSKMYVFCGYHHLLKSPESKTCTSWDDVCLSYAQCSAAQAWRPI